MSFINFTAKDIVAIIVLIGIGLLKLKGQDGQLDIAAALILGYYFARRNEQDHMSGPNG